MPHIQGMDRQAVVRFPPSLDEYIAAENPVRFIDAFVDSLDLESLGFARVKAADTGRPPYHPGDLLKLYIYGYLNRIRSSRRLEKEAGRNVEVMWLLKKLKPDHKTISDFRKDNLEPLKRVCREFTVLCKRLELFGGELAAIDGSKFKAVNSRRRNYNKKKVERALKRIEEKIEGYLSEMGEGDRQEAEGGRLTEEELKDKISQLLVRQEKYEQLQQELESGASQVSLTDPGSRSMPVGMGTDVCYNVQIGVDSKHKLIVEHKVTNAVTDQGQLASMALRTKETLGVESLDVVADKGYYDGQQVKACEEEGIRPYISKPQTSANKKRGLYTKADFTYDAEGNIYRCPHGAELTFRFETEEKGRHIRYYATTACRDCPFKEQCTRNKRGRRITRWVDEHILEAMAQRVQERPDIMKERQAIVEHPFGTMKRAMQQGYFLLRGLVKVAAEMSLTVLAYNIKRVITILGVEKMIAALA